MKMNILVLTFLAGTQAFAGTPAFFPVRPLTFNRLIPKVLSKSPAKQL